MAITSIHNQCPAHMVFPNMSLFIMVVLSLSNSGIQ
ncbi:hypothetical protein HP15_179 [Marinobacter adhaerens HP15]|uniref:Uncharacterized protein n=1 Tax=Marinobacter adhaerens (strain DSM 23420 / HP15) TaxID=225937 RepID=E4PK12_MARAH|nr:hypothetical protein HP15_179 [Marinobacter adhaerens HP15]